MEQFPGKCRSCDRIVALALIDLGGGGNGIVEMKKIGNEKRINIAGIHFINSGVFNIYRLWPIA